MNIKPLGKGFPPDLIGLFACPDCNQKPQLRHTAPGFLQCPLCLRIFGAIEGDILDMAPLIPPSLNPFYNNVHYQKANKCMMEMLEYVEGDNAIFKMIHHSGHKYVANIHDGLSDGEWLLDIGVGHGAHTAYYKRPDRVISLDMDVNCLRRLREGSRDMVIVRGDTTSIPLVADSMKYVISTYCMEHIFHLEKAVEEMSRIMVENGVLGVSIPCEGGFLWNMGRRLTTARHLSRKLGVDYSEVIQREHCNRAWTVEDAFRKYFMIENKQLWPFGIIKLISANLVLSFTGVRRK